MGMNAFAFIYHDMNPGGIQKYIHNYLEVYQREGFDTFWVAPNHPSIDEGFQSSIQKTIRLTQDRRCVGEALSKYDTVITLSFSALDIERMMEYTQDLLNVKHFFLIPHFKNPEIHLEELFGREKDKKKNISEVSKLYSRYISNKQLFYINPKHGMSLCEHYGIDNAHVPDHVCKKIRSIQPFDVSSVEHKTSQTESFNIITVARLEFPHKGYILGLVDSFPEIKKEIPSAKLVIIGYGEGMDELKKHIANLSDDLKSDITCVGKVSYCDLKKYYNEAHVSVSLAGSVTDSVLFGVPALIARHYTTKCEGYGFYCDNPDKTLCDEPGEDLVPHLARVYNMDKTDYCELCIKNYQTFEERAMTDYDPLWMTKVEQPITQYTPDPLIIKLKKQMKQWTFRYRFKMLFTKPSVFLGKAISKVRTILHHD